MPHEQTTETTPRDQAYFDIFVTALEGGIGYWSVCHEYRWRRPGTDGTVDEVQDTLGFHAVISEEDGVTKRHTINRETIAKGVREFIAWAKEGNPSTYFKQAAVDLDWGKWDDLDVDADIADAIVQFGLFGKLVFG